MTHNPCWNCDRPFAPDPARPYVVLCPACCERERIARERLTVEQRAEQEADYNRTGE